MVLTLFLILLFFVLPDLYISLAVMKGMAWWAYVLLWLPTIVVLALLVSIRFTGIGPTKIQVVIGMLLCVAMPQIVFSLFSLLGRLLACVWPQSLAVGNGIGLVGGVFVLLIAVYGVFFGWKTLTVKEVELSFADLPQGFDGYKIVQLSDLHVGTHGKNAKFLKAVACRSNEEHPDLLVFTGDLINLSPNETAPFESVLTGLKAKDGVLSVLGNHDYCIHAMFGQRPADMREAVVPVIEAERRMGWDVLLNEHRILSRGGDSIAIVGVENTGKPPFPEIGDLKGAMAGIPEGTFTILLSHDPSHWRMEVVPETDIPLMLSGHTHAMQFKLGRWSPSKWLYPEWSGLYKEGDQRLYVSEGLGGSIPFRFGTKPQFVVITLRKG